MDCGMELVGRSDKRFCGDACRSNYHNRRLAKEREKIKRVNAILRRNRRLLVECSRSSHLQIKKTDFMKRGFDFDYFTQQKKRNGKSIYFCYEMAYQEVNEAEIQLILED